MWDESDLDACSPAMRIRLGAAERAGLLTPEVHESTLSWRVGVEYQPLVDVHTRETVAHEALARFRAADGSALAPARVFPELRRDLSLLAEVELQLKHLQIDRAPGRAVFLNLDPDAWHAAPPLTRRELLDRLSARCHVEIVVEVVESGDERAAARARAMMRELREASVSVALDDVGASGAVFSIDALRGADVVKFDRSFLDRPRDPRERAIARGLVAVARALGARTVLEGVERPEHLRLAEELGFDLVQGFLLRDRTVVVEPASP
jgi:EAL domain-containing protein (putative c-di-GMP-specific phosphodiesterase class I)